MLNRIIVTLDPTVVSQGTWDDFCHTQGLALRDTGYFAANGLHAGCQGGRASFFSRDYARTSRLAASFLHRFGGQVTVQLSPRVLVTAGA